MPKEALSVTLEKTNIAWLRGKLSSSGRKRLSDLLDSLVTAARSAARMHGAAIRSVVGTVDIDPEDPELSLADQAVRSLFPR